MPPVSYYKYRTEWAGLQSAFARAWPNPSRIPYFMKSESLISLAAQMEVLALDLKRAQLALPIGMNALTQILAKTDQRFSQQYSAGPVDPRQTNPNAAWKIPVRRITSHYFMGWMVKRVAPGVWIVYNATREAYYIEFGIHTSGRRVRRPIRKMALIKTLRYADTHRVGQYVWEGVFGVIRGHGGGYNRGQMAVHFQPQSPAMMGSL